MMEWSSWKCLVPIKPGGLLICFTLCWSRSIREFFIRHRTICMTIPNSKSSEYSLFHNIWQCLLRERSVSHIHTHHPASFFSFSFSFSSSFSFLMSLTSFQTDRLMSWINSPSLQREMSTFVKLLAASRRRAILLKKNANILQYVPIAKSNQS